MSSISSTSTSQLNSVLRSPPPSPKSRITSAIGGEVASGAITSTDATALTSALDSIDSSLKAGGTSDASTSGSSDKTRLDPSSIKERVDGLIADQVSNGTLTSDQASTLKSLFAQGSSQDQDAGAVGEAGGARRHGGHRGPPPSDDAGSGPSITGSASSTTSSTSDASSTSELLANFIKQLQTAQTGSTGYAASGTSASGSSASSSNASALLFDFQS